MLFCGDSRGKALVAQIPPVFLLQETSLISVGTTPTAKNNYGSVDMLDVTVSGRERDSLNVLLEPKRAICTAPFSVRTLNQIWRQAVPERTLETFKVDAPKMGTHDPVSVNAFHTPGRTSFTLFNVRVSVDPVLSASGQTGFGIALSIRSQCAL